MVNEQVLNVSSNSCAVCISSLKGCHNSALGGAQGID